MVTEIPTNNETLGLLSLKDEIDGLYDYEGRTLEDNAFAIAILFYLLDFNNKYSTKTLNYVEKHYEDDLEKLRGKLLDKADKEADTLYNNGIEMAMKEYNILESDFHKLNPKLDIQNLKTTISSTINASINQIKDDIQVKINTWKDDIAKKAKDFSIKPNINRLTRRIRNTIDYATSRIKWESRKTVLRTVYSKRQLYNWYCAGPNPCKICIAKSKESAKPLDEWEADHPNGYCILVPVGDPIYTDEYLDIIGGREI